VFNGCAGSCGPGAVARTAARPAALPAVYQQTQRWLRAGVFESLCMTCGPCCVWRRAERVPSAIILDGRTLQSSPETGRAPATMGPRSARSKVHIAVDTLGHLLALCVTLRTSKSGRRSRRWRGGCTGDRGHGGTGLRRPGLHRRSAAADAQAHGIRLEWSSCPKPARLRPFAQALGRRTFVRVAAGFRRLARDYERLPETVAGLHFVAFATLCSAMSSTYWFKVHNTL